MILLWRDPKIPEFYWEAYAHAWRRAGAEAGEAVLSRRLDDTLIRHEWDLVNTRPGRYTIWVRPEFIPFPSFFDELDLFREENQLVVALQAYDAAFNPNQEVPYKWTPNGVLNSLVVFQLTGQTTVTLPPSTRTDPFVWLSRTSQRYIYKVPQRYAGSKQRGITTRSTLGEVVYSPFGTNQAVGFGKLITGGQLVGMKQRQFETWENLLRSWEIWLK